MLLSPLFSGMDVSKGSLLQSLEEIYAAYLTIKEDEMKNLKQDFHDMYDHVVNISSSEKADADNKEALILLVLTLVTQAAINKRIAEKIIDEFFTANK